MTLVRFALGKFFSPVDNRFSWVMGVEMMGIIGTFIQPDGSVLQIMVEGAQPSEILVLP